MKSFRLRLALLSGTFAGLLLLATGIYAWRLTEHFNLDRLDHELRNLGAANLERVVGDEHWRRVESALRFVSGADRPPGFALLVSNYDREVYRSPHWPQIVDPASLPEAKNYEGGVAWSTPPLPPRTGEPISHRNPALPRLEPRFVTLNSQEKSWRVAIMGNPYTTLVLAADVDDFNAELANLRRTFLAALPVALLLVGGGAWFLAGRALRPVQTLTQAAERVTALGLDQRITAPGNVLEFRRLVTVFNTMLDGLEKSFHQARRFSADASHELKTPLALLQAEIEQALHVAPAGAPEQQVYSSLLDEIHRLKAILEKLLLLSLADSGRLALERVPTQLSSIVINVIEDCGALAPDLRLECDLVPPIEVQADAVLLEQALQNLANNAVKFNRPDGLIRITLAVGNGLVKITFGNTGAGISEGERDRVFERFYRGDPARSRLRVSGAGLGLSLSSEILQAHGGSLQLGRTDDDWTEFIITLPVKM